MVLFLYICEVIIFETINITVTECIFGRNPSALDILETTDCSCKNYDVQFKLTQITTEYPYLLGALSANRKDPVLSNSGRTKFINFCQKFFDDNVFYRSSLAPDTIARID